MVEGSIRSWKAYDVAAIQLVAEGVRCDAERVGGSEPWLAELPLLCMLAV